MHHPGSFVGNVIGSEKNFELWWKEVGSWYKKKNINFEEAKTWPLKTGLEVGDIVLVSGWGDLKVGDVIVFNANQRHPIIHRIVEIKNVSGEIFYSTKGDNNSGQLASEKNISQEAVLGKAIFRIPKVGWVKLVFVKLFELLF